MATIGAWELDLRTSHLWWSDEVYRIFEIGRDEETGISAGAKILLVEDDSLLRDASAMLLAGPGILSRRDHRLRVCRERPTTIRRSRSY